jgi:hypothetical protein
LDGVNAGSFFWVFVGIVDLDFVALGWPAFLLKFRVEVDARVGSRQGFDFGFELEIFEIVVPHRAIVEEVGTDAVCDEFAVTNLEGGWGLVDFPTVERFTVKDPGPAVLIGCAGWGKPKGGGCKKEWKEWGFFHGVQIRERKEVAASFGGNEGAKGCRLRWS